MKRPKRKRSDHVKKMHARLKRKPKEEKFRKTAKRSKGTRSFLREMRKQARKNKKKGQKKNDPF